MPQGGHIPGSMWVPSETFELALDDVAAELAQVDTVVVHCMYCQQRGPACAAMLEAALRRLPDARARVAILNGGYAAWKRAFRNTPAGLIDMDE